MTCFAVSIFIKLGLASNDRGNYAQEAFPFSSRKRSYFRCLGLWWLISKQTHLQGRDTFHGMRMTKLFLSYCLCRVLISKQSTEWLRSVSSLCICLRSLCNNCTIIYSWKFSEFCGRTSGLEMFLTDMS